MFDLEQRIAAWRASMVASLGDKTDVIDELESHLREQLHRLALEGHAADEAWQRALERLGRPRQLAEEFGKNRSPEPLRWIAAWFVLSVYVFLALGTLVFMFRREDRLLGTHVFAVTTGYSAILALGALAIWSFLVRLARGGDNGKAARLTWWAQRFSWAGLILTLIGVVTGAFWSSENLGRFWNWDAREIGGMAVIVWSAVALRQLWRANEPGATGWILGLIGNMVVWSAWFGPHLFGAGLHSYGTHAPLGLVFVVFMSVHAALLAFVVAMSRFAPPTAASR